MKKKVLALLTALSVLTGFAAESPRRVLELPPSAANARNSEGDFVRLRDGRILFVYTHYDGASSHDDAHAHLASRVSDDEGRSWSPEDRTVVERGEAMNIMSVSLLRAADGRIALFYLRKDSPVSCVPVLRWSSDEAKSWSKPTVCLPLDAKGYFVLNNNRAAQLACGRLVLPLCLHRPLASGKKDMAGELVCSLSDDGGRTWHYGGLPFATHAGDGRRVTTQEPGVVELKDGRLMMWARTGEGVQYVTYSSDHGETWEQPQPWNLFSPCSPAQVVRLRGGDLLAVWNDHEGRPELSRASAPSHAGYRTPLCVAVSRDEGRSWDGRKTLEGCPYGWYCYVSVLELDDAVLFGYCAHSHLSHARVTRVPTAWLLDGEPDVAFPHDDCERDVPRLTPMPTAFWWTDGTCDLTQTKVQQSADLADGDFRLYAGPSGVTIHRSSESGERAARRTLAQLIAWNGGKPLIRSFRLYSAAGGEVPRSESHVSLTWRPPKAPQPGTKAYEAVAAAYALRTPDRAIRFADDGAFVGAIYGRDFTRDRPDGTVVLSWDAATDECGRDAALQRVVDELRPGDLVWASDPTNGRQKVAFYAGDVYGDGHGKMLVRGRSDYLVEKGYGALFNWPLKDPLKLRNASRFAVLRPLADAQVVLAEKRAFPAGRWDDLSDERVRSVVNHARARYLKGPSIQYDSSILLEAALAKRTADYSRLDVKTPVETATPDQTVYSVCSALPYEVYWENFGYGLGDDFHGHLSFQLTLTPPPDCLVYKYDAATNTNRSEDVIRAVRDLLRPGDVISYANVYEKGRPGVRSKRPGGHVLLYVGCVDGIPTVIESAGQKYVFDEGWDRVELEGSIIKSDADDLLFDFEKPYLMKRDQFVILRPLMRKDLALTPVGRERAGHPAFRVDRRVSGGVFGSVVSGEELTYAVQMRNADGLPCEATVEETLPDGTELSFASEGCEVKGRNLKWPLTLKGGEVRTVTWRVKVTAPAGSRIVSAGGNAGGIPSNRLETEVVARRLSAEEAFAWADRNIVPGSPLPACRVRGWSGGMKNTEGVRTGRLREARARDLMPGDVVVSQVSQEKDPWYRIWIKGSEGLMERRTDGSWRTVSEAEVTALLACDFFMAFRPAAADCAKPWPFCKTVADATCAFTASGTCGTDVAFAEFTLKPEPESEIRCRIELPPADKWNGELWGVGNSSAGGRMPKIAAFSADGCAVVTTDLGTERYVFGDCREKPVPDAVRRDLFWRATHLMTVYAKKIVRAHYGRNAAHAYFRGGSCGGRQGLSEAQRFPDDYDGILAGIPAATTALAEAQALNVYEQTHDAAGRELVTRDQLRIVADAAVEYMADKDVRPYAGKVLSNPFLSDADIEGFLALAARKDPQLAGPEIRKRLKNIYTGVVRNGRRVCHGAAAGAFLGNVRGGNFTSKGRILMRILRKQNGGDGASAWDDYEKAVALFGAEANATSTDFSAFRDRGGKIIMTTAWEDQTLPPSDHLAWYESVVAAMGGLEKTQSFFRLFPLPGQAHGGGLGRISQGSGVGGAHMRLLRRWVTKGVAPDVFPHAWKAERLTIPVPPYPLQAYQDESGAWQTRRYPENMVRMPDAEYLKCNLRPWEM